MAYVELSRYIKLQNENNTLKQQLENFVPRRKVRQALKILEKTKDIDTTITILNSILEGE